MSGRFLVYGATGWILEVLHTGAHSLLVKRDRSATATTYLWMLPIYGAGGLLLERASPPGRVEPRYLRWLRQLAVIYGVEYATGWTLRRVLGRCPWDYTAHARLHLSGLVRFDYTPFWFGVALLFDRLRTHLTPPSPARKYLAPTAQEVPGT
jgi:uncharacterized membrane protein